MDFTFGVKKTKKEDKNQFLKAQKEARQQRELEKHKLKCATKIQAVYRGSKIREKILKETSADSSKKLSDVYKLKGKLPPQHFSIIANKLFQYKGLLSFVVFLKPSNAKKYQELVFILSDLVLASLETEDAIFLNILNKNKENRMAWYVKIKHILLSLLQVTYVKEKSDEDRMIDDSQQELKLAEILLKKLTKINSQEWPILDKAQEKNKELNLSLRKYIKPDIKKSISSHALQSIIFSAQFNQSPFLRNFILKTATDRSDISSDMFMELLGLQSFYNDLLPMKVEKRNKLIAFLTRQIEQERAKKASDRKFLGKFLAEIVEFFHFIVSNKLLEGFDVSFFHNIFKIFSEHIETYNLAVLSSPESQKEISSNMEVEEEKSNIFKDAPAKKRAEQLRLVITHDPSMALTLEEDGIKHFCETLSGIFSLFTSADFESFSTLVAKGCEILLQFQQSLNHHDKNLCKNILSFKLNFYYLPFMCIKRQGYNVKSMFYVPERYIPIIKVFSKVLYQTLRITDDEEFLGNNEIIQSNWLLIKKDELIEVAQFSNNLLYNVIWNATVPYYPVISSTVKLVRELQNRDTRLKYCPKDFWIIPELVKVSEQMLASNDHLKVNAIQDILNKAPHMLTFETRLKFFHRIIEQDKEGHDRFPGFDPDYDIDDEDGEEHKKDPKVVTIQRNFLLEDGFEKILKRKDMRSLFMIRFINEHGMPEEGIDGGGLLKEFITLISKIAFDINYGLFIEYEDKTLTPNPNSPLIADHLKLFKFIGRLTGKAIYEHILLESVFSVVFLNRLLKIPNTINELKYADPTLYKNLMLLKHRTDVANNLGLTFSVDETSFGQARTHLLKANGDKIEVNESNKLEYISLFSDYKLNKLIENQSQAFLEGLKSVIDVSWVKLFNHEELQVVISGIRRKGFNVADMQTNVEYRGFTTHDPTIVYFWEIINEMTDEERSLFLLYVTGCSRPPTLGFKYMEPKIAIHNYSQNAYDIEKLPTASTCANLFKLPNYKNKELLKKKLLYAINANAGFDLG